MKRILVLAYFLCSANADAQHSTIFDPYLNDDNPKIISENVDADSIAGVSLKKVIFALGDSSQVFCLIASPKQEGTYPGIVVLHGGGGSAEIKKAIAWAKRGYVAIAPDLPGIAKPEKLNKTLGRWNQMEYGQGRYTAAPDIRSSVIYDAVASAVKALKMLQRQPHVDKQRIGVVGVSWGGYMTTMLCGIAGNQVRAGFSIYGCGFYEFTSNAEKLRDMDKSERIEWLTHLDAGRYAANVSAAFFVAGATNDFFFWPEAVQKTLNEIRSEKNQVYSPNSNHEIRVPGGTGASDTAVSARNWMSMEVPFMDYYLKDKGDPFPRINPLRPSKGKKFRFRVVSKLPVIAVSVYYRTAEGEVPPEHCWEKLDVGKQRGDTYSAELPANAVEWFSVVTDSRSITVSSPLMGGEKW